MANRRVLIKRRKAVRNIRKITRTMQLIATARFQAAYNRAMATRPYADKLAEMVADLSGAAGQVRHPLMGGGTSEGRVPVAPGSTLKKALVIITSRRGLCGGYNAGVLRVALAHLEGASAEGGSIDVYMVGKKGVNYFRFLRKEMHERITAIGDSPRFDEVEPLANTLMDRFADGRIERVDVAFMRFQSTAVQRPAVLSLLPISASTLPQGPDTRGVRKRAAEYEYSPTPKELLDELLPATVRMRLFQCFTDAVVSEQVARMVAMKAATDAAGDMITMLTRQYNRARQTQITMELLDIVGGANAIA